MLNVLSRMRWLSMAMSVCALVVVGTTVASAQAFKAGDKVEYKAQNFPEKWEAGTVIRELPGGRQLLIREVPTEFFPEGFERAYSLNEIRPVTPPPPPPPAGPAPGAPTAPAAAPLPPAAPAVPAGQPVPATAAPVTTPLPGGGAPMSQQQVLGFLRDRLGPGDPFRNPQRDQVLAELRNEVLRRGVDFRYATLGDFSNELGKFGALSNVTAPLAKNYGAPATVTSLTGRWLIAKVGATTTFARGGDLYQRQEYAGNAGSLEVNADGSYRWDSPSGLLIGRWRNATPDELALSDKGGAGVVLMKAKSGADWLVHSRNEEGPQGQGILITDLATRNLRERATRR